MYYFYVCYVWTNKYDCDFCFTGCDSKCVICIRDSECFKNEWSKQEEEPEVTHLQFATPSSERLSPTTPTRLNKTPNQRSSSGKPSSDAFSTNKYSPDITLSLKVFFCPCVVKQYVRRHFDQICDIKEDWIWAASRNSVAVDTKLDFFATKTKQE